MNEHYDLNGRPEDRIPLKEGQEHLAGTGMTVIMQITGGTGTYYGVELPKDACLTIKGRDFETDTISFCLQNEVVIKITKEGFFWKGKLVENDKEIYQKFKEFLNKAT
jgi:hypothetical protein